MLTRVLARSGKRLLTSLPALLGVVVFTFILMQRWP